jgi:hypothetical protein
VECALSIGVQFPTFQIIAADITLIIIGVIIAPSKFLRVLVKQLVAVHTE